MGKRFSKVGIWFLIGLIFFSGCSLMNPHVTWERPDKTATNPNKNDEKSAGVEKPLKLSEGGENSANKAKGKIVVNTSISFEDGENYANRAKDEYKKAIGDQAELNNWLALGLIPLAGAAIGLGVQEASGAAITALSLTGASAYGIGTWLSSPQRTKTYVAGIKAMGCAITAMRPLDIDGSEFSGDLITLNEAISHVSTEITVVETSINTNKDFIESELINRANTELSKASALLDTAGATYGVGVGLKHKISNAGKNLIQAVDDIGADVDMSISLTLKDLSALPEIISSLSQISSQFTLPATTEPKPTTKVKKDLDLQTKKDRDKSKVANDALNDALKILRGKVRSLSQANLKVASVVTSVNAQKPIEKLKSCGVAKELLVAEITIDPSGTITVLKGGSKGFIIKGGNKPFAASFQDDAKGLKVKQIQFFGPNFVISAGMDAEGNKQHTLFVTDGSNHTKFITVEVTDKKNGNGVDPNEKTSEQLKNEKIANTALGLPNQDLGYDKEDVAIAKYEWKSNGFRDALKNFQTERKVDREKGPEPRQGKGMEGDNIPKDTMGALVDVKSQMDKGTILKGARNEDERKLKKNELEEYQKLMDLKENEISGIFDKKTRMEIIKLNKGEPMSEDFIKELKKKSK